MQLFIEFSYNVFYFCKISTNVSSFTPDFSHLSLLFFLISPAKSVYIFSFQEVDFVFIDFYFLYKTQI